MLISTVGNFVRCAICLETPALSLSFSLYLLPGKSCSPRSNIRNNRAMRAYRSKMKFLCISRNMAKINSRFQLLIFPRKTSVALFISVITHVLLLARITALFSFRWALHSSPAFLVSRRTEKKHAAKVEINRHCASFCQGGLSEEIQVYISWERKIITAPIFQFYGELLRRQRCKRKKITERIEKRAGKKKPSLFATAWRVVFNCKFFR